MTDTDDDNNLNVRVRTAAAGWDWFRQAGRLFAQQPLTWIATLVVYVLLLSAASFVPLGDLLTSVLGAVVLGGMLIGAHRQALGGRMEITDLISGFRGRFVPLLLLGVIQLLASVIVGVIAVVVAMVVIGPGILGATDPLAQISPAQWAVLAVVLSVVIAALAMAFWIATPLVAVAGCKPWEGVERSFDAALRNWRAVLVYGLAAIGLLVLAVIPLGLGLFVLFPVLVLTGYTAFADLFWPDPPTGPASPGAPPSNPDANLPPPASTGELS